MKIFFIVLLTLLSVFSIFKVNKSNPGARILSSSVISTDTCIDFNSLNNKIRDRTILKEEAIRQIQLLLPELKLYFYKNGGKNILRESFVFPVQGYNSKAIGGKNGSGYIASGFNYFDGNNHAGHPAHDIFIADKNQDCIDDKTKQPVNILSMSAGIVIATEPNWDTTSNLRGGKYIWIYDPSSNSLFYYAHSSNIFVKPCDIVKPGDIIATVGRTGLNAFRKKSPTHLHVMQLKLDSNNFPQPYNCYKELINLKN